MIRMKATGIAQNILRLRNIGDRVKENARKTMHRQADKIVDIAKQMAPVDEGNLEDSIRKRVGYEASSRLAIDIEISTGLNARLDVYATVMHEGRYNLGPKSVEKQGRVPYRVGRRFLVRAADEVRGKLNKQMIDAIEDVIE